MDPLISFLTAWGLLAMPPMLSSVASDYQVSVQLAGQTSTASAIALALGGPVTIWFARSLNIDKLLRIAIAGFAVFQCLSAFAISLEQLLICRFLVGLSASVIFPLIASRSSQLPLVARAKRLGSLSIAFTLAATIGMPVVAIAVQAFGWRTALLVTGSCVLLFLLLMRKKSDVGVSAPSALGPPGKLDRGMIVRNAAPLLFVTTLQSLAQMMVFTYLEGLIHFHHTFQNPGVVNESGFWHIGWLYFFFGLAGILGNLLLPVLIRRWGDVYTCVGLILTIALAFAVWRGLMPKAWGLVFPIALWGLAGAAIGVCQQSRLLETCPELARLLSASHSSCIYVGQALGAVGGGLAIHYFGFYALLDFAICILIGAVAFTMMSSLRVRPQAR
jgi:predicted MFS family arabinose efflux permease